VTLREAAQRLGLSLTIVRCLIAEKKLPATQVITYAPWQIPAEALDSEAVRAEVENIKNGVRAPQTPRLDGQQALFSDT
jgi:excisionase family DNA binding protein